MKIAYLLTSLANAGPINVALDLVNVMMAHGHSCKVFYFKDKNGNDFPCETVRASFGSSIDFSEFDVIHSHGLLPDAYMMIHREIRLRRDQRYFTTIHSFIFDDHRFKYGKFKSFFTSRLTLTATLRADKVITLGHVAMEHFKGHIADKRLTWAYNTRVIDTNEPIDIDDVEIISDFKRRYDFTIGTICSFNVRKGLEQLIRALTLLPDSGLILIGDGDIRPTLEKLAETIGVSERVLFLGSRPKGYRYLGIFDVYAIPSRSEGFPLALLEAACAGKASVSSDIPVFKEIFSDDEVVKYELDNVTDLADKLTYANSHKSELGPALRKKYDEAYSPEHFYSRHLTIYQGND